MRHMLGHFCSGELTVHGNAHVLQLVAIQCPGFTIDRQQVTVGNNTMNNATVFYCHRQLFVYQVTKLADILVLFPVFYLVEKLRVQHRQGYAVQRRVTFLKSLKEPHNRFRLIFVHDHPCHLSR